MQQPGNVASSPTTVVTSGSGTSLSFNRGSKEWQKNKCNDVISSMCGGSWRNNVQRCQDKMNEQTLERQLDGRCDDKQKQKTPACRALAQRTNERAQKNYEVRMLPPPIHPLVTTVPGVAGMYVRLKD